MSILIALALAATSTAQTDAPFARQPEQVVVPINPADRKEEAEWGYSDAVIEGDRIWLSGVVASLRSSETEADQEAAYERAFRGLSDVLGRAGSSFDGVVEMTTYHTDLPAQIDAFKRVKSRYIRAPYPAWTAIDIDRLVPDRGLVEIKIVARRQAAEAKR